MSSDLVLACRFDGCDAGINSYFGHRSSRLAVAPPVELMPAKLAHELTVGAYLYEPKWDGFRAIVFRGEDKVYIQSRDSRPLDHYFPELHDALLEVRRGGSTSTPCIRLHPAAVTKPYELERFLSSGFKHRETSQSP